MPPFITIEKRAQEAFLFIYIPKFFFNFTESSHEPHHELVMLAVFQSKAGNNDHDSFFSKMGYNPRHLIFYGFRR